MGNLETVRVKSGDDYAIINASDFDAEVHELFEEAPEAAEPDGGEGSDQTPDPTDTDQPTESGDPTVGTPEATDQEETAETPPVEARKSNNRRRARTK